VALDYEVGELDDDRWSRWQERPADQTPQEEDRRLGPGGFHYALRGRIGSFDVAAGRVTRALLAWQWRGSDLVGHETHTLTVNIYSSEQMSLPSIRQGSTTSGWLADANGANQQ
jgi:hypothetical protein